MSFGGHLGSKEMTSLGAVVAKPGEAKPVDATEVVARQSLHKLMDGTIIQQPLRA